MRFITLLLVLATSALHAQECVELTPEVKTMGLSQRLDVNLDDVEPVTLPVVFHIIHKGSAHETNISDEQILSQIDALDTGFRWGPGVDTKIQFCLASRDPEGNPTSGITRHNGINLFGQEYAEDGVAASSIEDGIDDEMMKEATGCWNPSEYINFYIVSEIAGNDGGNGIQGYAYLGPTGDCRDGIVQLYNATGTTGTLKPGRTLGKTGVHEMGHHLSLFHTFSNSFGCTESNCESQGDMVCDTPPTQSNQGCSTSSGCEDAMIENFMDYTSETCKYSFTVGQAERMHQQLQGVRSGLVNSLSCLAPVEYDLAITEAFYQDSWCVDFQDIWVTVVNQGAQNIPIAEVQLLCNGEQYNETVFDLGYGNGVSVLFEDVFVDEAQMFEAQVISSLDQYDFNDNAWWPIETLDGDLLTIDVHKDFWGCVSFQFFDTEGEAMIDDYYNAGEETYTYNVCVYEGCYTVAAQDCAGDGFCTFGVDENGNCQYGSEGIVGTIGQDTVFATGWGLQFYEWEQTWCNAFPQCNMDYDGNGYIGTPDVLTLLTDLGCNQTCYTDPNNDGVVNIQDLLFMLASVGPCPEE